MFTRFGNNLTLRVGSSRATFRVSLCFSLKVDLNFQTPSFLDGFSQIDDFWLIYRDKIPMAFLEHNYHK